MKHLFYTGLMVLFTGNAWSYVNVDADVSASLENRITRLDLTQQVGAERIECGKDAAGNTGVVSVVRIAKTKAFVSAAADVRASCNARAHYSDSCSCSGSGSCSTSGSGSDSDSTSGSDSASSEKVTETKFTVARISEARLKEKGFSLNPNSSCELVDATGFTLDPLGAVAVVTLVYGEELVTNNPLAMKSMRNSITQKLMETDIPKSVSSSESIIKNLLFNQTNSNRFDGGNVK
ncbi:MAG: hypothetical protein A2021_02920 [Elusimicrobia bacterium GWF2_52_66]|nr:MAG: hypothetical protein A2X33_08735 [Elusimicrobia bacterium GWA2_51_34]OGR87067.1 MAG: hypothetical protein A2021_02920 [Elusimicrobia bacterium GWF2_52_66]HAF96044.1 hypothetical protein [Elusimicrobiota bacterium]HCE98653.1 hypothetical protein [Elusimicrobiota bacterium]